MQTFSPILQIGLGSLIFFTVMIEGWWRSKYLSGIIEARETKKRRKKIKEELLSKEIEGMGTDELWEMSQLAVKEGSGPLVEGHLVQLLGRVNGEAYGEVSALLAKIYFDMELYQKTLIMLDQALREIENEDIMEIKGRSLVAMKRPDEGLICMEVALNIRFREDLFLDLLTLLIENKKWDDLKACVNNFESHLSEINSKNLKTKLIRVGKRLGDENLTRQVGLLKS